METKKWTIAEVDIKMNEAVKNIQDLKTQIEAVTIAKLKSQSNPLSKDYIESSAQLKLLNTELRNQEKALQQVITVSKIESGTLEKVNAESNLLRLERAKLRVEDENYEKELLRINAALNENSKFIIDNSDAQKQQILNVGNYEGETKSLRLQLRETTQQMQQLMLAGKENTKEFQDLAKKAGVLKDSMNAVNDQVNTLATGNKLESFVKFSKGAFDAVAGSAQAAEGAMQLMGSENENVTKGIQKMMALQSLSNGVNQVYNSLIKEGALVTGIMTAKTWLQTTAIGAYNLVVGTSTGLMKAFKIALAGTGIGLLVIAIMGAVQAMGLFNDETEDAIKKSEELDNIINKSNQSRNTKISLIEKEIELLNAQGATADEIYKKEKELIELKLFNSRVAIASGLTDEKLTKEVLVREGLKMDLEILNAKNKKRLADENEKLQSENEAKEKKRIEDKIKRDKEIEDLEQKRIDNQLRLLNYELELWKLNNKSKLESNQKLSEDLIAQETQRLQIEFEKNLAYQNELLLQDKITNEEYNLFKIESQQTLNETISQLNKDFETQEQARKLEAAQTNFDNEMEILEGQTFKILELEKDKLTRQRQQEIEAALESGADIGKIIKKFDKAELQLEQAKANAKLSIYANTADQIANIFGETTEIGKIAAVASATIQTYLGAQAAFTQTTLVAGPIFGAIAAASAVATGLSNVKKILSVDAKGKSTPSIGSSSSSFSSPTQQKSESGAVSTVSDSEIGRGIVSRGVKATDLKNGYSTVLVVDDVTNSQMINKQRVNASTY